MEKKVLYFGYGTLSSSEMMKAIIGRKPKGTRAKLNNYELCIQKWKEIPSSAKRILRENWNSKFLSYFIRPKKGKTVFGKVWYLTKQEKKLVENWELIGLWYQSVKVRVRDYRGNIIKAESYMINDKNIKQAVNGKNYKMFLNKGSKMFKVARLVREKYIKGIKLIEF